MQIQTEALGLSAVEVEQFITVPMEQDLLNGVPWLNTIRSRSVAGLSTVDLVFQPGTDILKARQAVSERMTQAVALPHVSKPPVMIEPVSSTSRVMVIGLSAKDMSLIDMSVLARWRIKPRLMGIPGVANVSVWGQRERQLQVQVDPKQLAASGVTLDQVLTTTGNAMWVSPLTFVEASTPGTGGFLESNSQRLSIQHILPITSASDLAQVPLEGVDGGKQTRLGDVAKVVEDHQPLIGDAIVGGGSGLMLVVEKAPGANTLQVTRAVEEALRALQPGLGGVHVDTTVYRPATYIQSAIGNVGLALLIGLILMIALFALVFFDWRTAVVSAVAVTLSALVAGLVLHALGAGLNMLVLAGLVVALGALVDDAVVNVDGIRRRLREDPDTPRPALVAAAIHQARGPLVYATLVVLVAAVPLLLLGGLSGSFTRPLAWAYVAAVVTSTVVALTVTPAVTLALFPGSARPGESPLVRALRRGYLAVLPRQAYWGRLGVLLAAMAVAGSALLLPGMHGRLLPPLRDRNLLVSWTGTPSMSQPETTRITEAASAELRRVPGVTNVGVHVGRAITSDEQLGVNSGELWLTVAGNADYDATVARVERVIAQYPGFNHHVLTYPEQKVGQVRTGTRADLTVRVFGPQMDVLRSKAEQIRQLMSGVPGVVTPQVDTPPEQPTIEIEVNLTTAQRYGIKPGDVRRATAVLLSGLVAGSLFENQKVFDVVVLGTPSTRDSVTSIQNLVIDTPSGGHVRVGDVADVRVRPNPAVIQHDNVSRRVDVLADVRGRDAGSVAADIRARLAGIGFPEEYHAEVLQQSAQQGVNRTTTGALVGVVAALILLLLQVAFGSWWRAALVFVGLLAAPVGGILAARLDGGMVSLGSVVGVFAVWVLAARQVIALAWHARRAPDGVDERQIAGERFAPVLKSTLATGLFALPMVFLGHVAGLEMLRPLAVVVLGGLVSSTLLTLFVVPALLREGRDVAEERAPAEDELIEATVPLATD